jgi:outer membrane protein OmpA-like peptidoglycan-associated protein
MEGDAYIEIQGHTDNIGSESYNLKLGHNRADAAMRYLNMEQGIPMFRMNVVSYGEYKPIADNSTREGRAQNRRVTLVVME